ncbi:MAG: hypothetical protein ABIR67_01720 [Gaiellaceae bacterium]
MRSSIRASGHALPPPQAGKLVVGGRGAAAEHVVVERLRRGEQRTRAAREPGFALHDGALAFEQLGLEGFERIQGGVVRRRDGLLCDAFLGRGHGCTDAVCNGVLEAEVGAKPGIEVVWVVIHRRTL